MERTKGWFDSFSCSGRRHKYSIIRTNHHVYALSNKISKENYTSFIQLSIERAIDRTTKQSMEMTIIICVFPTLLCQIYYWDSLRFLFKGAISPRMLKGILFWFGLFVVIGVFISSIHSSKRPRWTDFLRLVFLVECEDKEGRRPSKLVKLWLCLVG